MANEINHTTRLQWSRGGASLAATVTETEDQAAEYVVQQLMHCTAESRVINFRDVTDPKYFMLKNCEPKDSGLDVLIAQDTPENLDLDPTIATIRLKPQQGVVLPNVGIVWAALAITEAKVIAVIIQR